MATFEEKLAFEREHTVNAYGEDDRPQIGRVWDTAVEVCRVKIARIETALRFLKSECLCGAVTALDEEVAL